MSKVGSFLLEPATRVNSGVNWHKPGSGQWNVRHVSTLALTDTFQGGLIYQSSGLDPDLK